VLFPFLSFLSPFRCLGGEADRWDGGVTGYTALIHLYAEFFTGGNLPEFLEHVHGHSHSHSHSDLGPNVNAAWLAAGSIVVKEWLYRSSKSVRGSAAAEILG